MTTLTMPPDIVIRPAGVWNSRAPFHDFVEDHKRIGRGYAMTVVAALRIKRDLGATGEALTSIRQYFAPVMGPPKKRRPVDRRATAAWGAYRDALGKAPATKVAYQPVLEDVLQDLESVVTIVREGVVIKCIALFESYFQCWTLNYLLAKLERQELWSNEERLLATRLSPVHGHGAVPGLSMMLRCVPEARRGLRLLPPFFTRPLAGGQMAIADPPALNALAALEFWAGVRNRLVHRSGWISSSFWKQHGKFWSLLLGRYEHIPALKHGRRISLFHEVVVDVQRTTYRCALWLSDYLEAFSAGKRGHMFAPGPRQEGPLPEELVRAPSPPLLLDGDYTPSYRWVTDENFRQQWVSDNARSAGLLQT